MALRRVNSALRYVATLWPAAPQGHDLDAAMLTLRDLRIAQSRLRAEVKGLRWEA